MSRRLGTAGLLMAVLGLAACAPKSATAPEPELPSAQCRLPPVINPAPQRPPPAAEVSPGVATAYYVLALSWSPEWCRTQGDDPAHALQCRQNDFGFVVHGLWPNGAGTRHPRFCAAAPPLDVATLRRSLCMTPSAELLQHEWAAHGTCGWDTPEAYFAQASALWEAIAPPGLHSATLTGGQIRDAFVQANPGLPREAIKLRVAGGNRLREVTICYSLGFRPIACPDGGGTPDRVVVQITTRRSDR